MKYINFFLFLIANLVFSQERIVHYTTAKGLPHDITYGIFQDSKGYIWIGTDNGLAKFDGQEFKVFTTDEGLRTNYVIDIDEDQYGNLGLATWGGGIHFIKKDSVIRPEILNDSLEKINNIRFFRENIIVENSRGNFIYQKRETGYHRVLKIAAKNKEGNYLLRQPGFRERTNGKLGVLDGQFVAYNGVYFSELNGEELSGIYNVSEDWKMELAFPFLQSKNIHSLARITDQEYVASHHDTLYFFDEKAIRFTAAVNTEGRIIEKILKTVEDEYLILAQGDNGFKKAYLHNRKENASLDLSQQLQINSPISDILFDHEGNIWLTTHGNGVFCVLNKDFDFSYLGDENLPEINVKGIAELNGEIFVLTSNFLSSFKNFEKDKSIRLKGLGKQLFKLSDDQIGVSFLGKQGKLRYPFLAELSGYRNFIVDSIGLISHVDSLKIHSLNTPPLANNRILFDAVFFKDTLWFATSNGPSYYQFEANTLKNKAIQGKNLSSNQINKFLKRNDSLWIATAKGLNLIHDEILEVFTKTDGLINNQVNALLIDHRNDLWIGTQQGISVYDGEDFINITEATGLLSPYVETIFEDSEKNIWIGGNKGVTIIDNKRRLELQSPPIVIVDQRSTSFNYNAISYNRSKALLCEYQIDKENWISLPTASGALNFSNLGSGDHTFQFRSRKQDGKWAYSKPVSFAVVLPWQKDWRYILLLTAIVFGVVILMVSKQLQKTKRRNKDLRLTIHRKQELERELSNVRENVARDFHDDLGNRLARISIFSNLLSDGDSQIDENDKELISQISTDADYLFKGTRDFIFSLKSESDYLEEVVTYLSDFGEEYFRQFNIDFVVNKDISRNIRLPYYWSKQLIFIFKEAMTNVAKHAECDRIEINFKYKFNTLTIICRDNGKGFDNTVLKSNRGIDNMKRRAQRIGGALEVLSELRVGTTVSFKGKTTPDV